MAVSFISCQTINDGPATSSISQTNGSAAVGDMIVLMIASRQTSDGNTRTVSSIDATPGCTAWVQRKQYTRNFSRIGTTVQSSQICVEVWYCFVTSAGVKTPGYNMSGSTNILQTLCVVLRGVQDQNNPFAVGQPAVNVFETSGASSSTVNAQPNPSLKANALTLVMGINFVDGAGNVVLTGGDAALSLVDSTHPSLRTFGAYKANVALSGQQVFTNAIAKYEWFTYADHFNGDAPAVVAGVGKRGVSIVNVTM